MSNVESQLVPTVIQSHTVAYRTLLVTGADPGYVKKGGGEIQKGGPGG